ncbi:hypothetical protein [Vallitalea okinawensis]|uniref:hypothetical protein n=1 Tax=Vallitalea okinawensis TaxID=2078660 RepID=UPI000CFD7344|nr:hypothetical protein [Vallitalea okinawensis]
MLVMSLERYLPTTVNTIVLQEDNIYFYMHRSIYDKALILADQHTLESLITLVDPKSNHETIQWFYEKAPQPLNILAPYIGLVEGDIHRDMEECCGVLHAICAALDIRRLITQPKELRQCISFSLSVKEEYQMAWEVFFMTAIPYAKRSMLIQQANPLSKPSVVYEGLNQQEIPRNSDWVEMSQGVIYNHVTGETRFSDADHKKTTPISEHDDVLVQQEDEEKDEVKKLLNF